MNRAKEVNRLFLFMVLVSIASPFLLGAFLPELTIYQSISISQTIFLVPVIIYVICTRGEILGELQINPLKASTVLLVFLLAVLLLPVMTWLNLFSMLFSSNHVASSMVGLSGDSLGRNLMYVAFIPALLEEFIFRGVYFQSYRPAGAWKAALFSGLCFGLLHMNLNQFCYAFVLGVIFALLVEATGSLVAPALVHFIINSSSVMALAAQQSVFGEEALQQTETVITRNEILAALSVYTFLALICGLLARSVFRAIVRSCGRRDHLEQALRRGAKFRSKAEPAYGEEAETEQRAFGADTESGQQMFGADTESGQQMFGADTESGQQMFGADTESGQQMFGTDAENESDQRTGKRYRIVTPAFLLGAAAAVIYMCVLEFVMVG